MSHSAGSDPDRETLALISHRISTVNAADEIWIMENGKIKDRGSPEDLRGRSNFYSDLIKKQELL